MENLEERVEQRLREIEKTREELVKYVGVSAYGLTKMLRRGTFKTTYMTKIAQFLNVTMSFFGSEYNSGSKNTDAGKPLPEAPTSTEVEHLKEMLKLKDELLKAKEELIATLKEKKT